jgi:hypothetical protein
MTSVATEMLVSGVCNPAGEANGYNGLYLTQDEMRRVVERGSMHNLPVMAEHSGSAIGHVISSFIDTSGQLNCVMQIEENSLPADLTRDFIRKGIAADLSLGYIVDIRNHANKLHAADKKIVEVSIVRKGARNGCHITAYENDAKKVVYAPVDAWSAFNME